MQAKYLTTPLVLTTMGIMFFIFQSCITIERVTGSGNITTTERSTGEYDEIVVKGSMNVHLEKGTEGNILVKTDDNLQDIVEIKVEGNTLIVGYT
ncbi:MAG: DUF2807 domain-containing protein [Flavobacteriales bacterium]|nr:DUF2807 domain-containing protein [Flavobacteriales bacterium]